MRACAGKAAATGDSQRSRQSQWHAPAVLQELAILMAHVTTCSSSSNRPTAHHKCLLRPRHTGKDSCWTSSASHTQHPLFSFLVLVSCFSPCTTTCAQQRAAARRSGHIWSSGAHTAAACWRPTAKHTCTSDGCMDHGVCMENALTSLPTPHLSLANWFHAGAVKLHAHLAVSCMASTAAPPWSCWSAPALCRPLGAAAPRHPTPEPWSQSAGHIMVVSSVKQ